MSSCSARVGSGECSGGSGGLAAGRQLRGRGSTTVSCTIRSSSRSSGASVGQPDVGERTLPAAGRTAALGRLVLVVLGSSVDGPGSGSGARAVERPSSTSASSITRSGILLIGVAVITSRPKSRSRTSSGTATQRGHRAFEQRADAEADQPAGAGHLDVVGRVAGRRAAGRGGDDDRGPADHRAAAVLRVGRLAHQPDRAVEQQQRQEHGQPAEEEPHRVGQPGADRARRCRPRPRRRPGWPRRA